MKTQFPERPKTNNLFRSWTGKLTEKLVQVPGDHGIGKVPKDLKPDATTEAVCGFCSTGCSLKIHLKDGEAVNLSADTHYPVNLGMACPKGWEALTPLASPDRATKPMLRNADGDLVPISWDEAMKHFVSKIKQIQKDHGPDSVAWLGTGQIPTEELAMLGSLGKFGMGIKHGDGNTRQCMATSVVAYKQSYGFDAPPYTYKDFEESDVIVLVGSNLCIAHPIMWQRVLRNKNNPEIIVVDPRKTETAMAATQHYAIEPKSDLVLFYTIANLLIQNGWVDTDYIEKHTNEFDAFKDFLTRFTLERAVKETGLTEKAINHFAKLIHEGKGVSFWWTMGVNQSYEGVRLAQSLINLALMTGNMGRPGTGANSITGQCNAMGSRLFSNTTGLLGGHDFTKPEHRTKVANILNIPEEVIPQEMSWAYDQIVEKIDDGTIKALWLVATNSSHSWINQEKFKKIAEKLDFFVVQDMYHTTESAGQALMVLPAAGWGEKEGTFINSERRIGRCRKLKKAPGEALSDFNIFKLIAEYWGCADLFKDWESPEATFKILTKLTEGQPCDITGITGYKMVEDSLGIQWPMPKENADTARERRLFSDGQYYHSDKRAKFMFEEPLEAPEKANNEYPFTLLTGRGTSSQWHTNTRTGKSDVLRKLYPKNIYAEINTADAERLGIKDQQKIKLSSKRGQIEVNAYVCNTVKPGQIFLPMHYEETNKLTFPSFDKYSRQPSYKACAIRIDL